MVAVGTRISPRPPGRRRRSPAPGSHRTWRADFPHHALRQLVHSFHCYLFKFRFHGQLSGVVWPTMPDSVSAGRRLDYSPGRRLQRHRAPILGERSIGRSRLDHRRTAWRAGSAVPADERSDPRRRIFSLRDSLRATDTMQESALDSIVPI